MVFQQVSTTFRSISGNVGSISWAFRYVPDYSSRFQGVSVAFLVVLKCSRGVSGRPKGFPVGLKDVPGCFSGL